MSLQLEPAKIVRVPEKKKKINGIVYYNYFVNMPSASKWNTDISFRDAPRGGN